LLLRVPRRIHQRGGALVEYIIVALFLILVLVAAHHTGVIAQLTNAVRDAYTSFVYALSISWI
jgi:Flp pilus assembly pilin Flp